MSGSVPYLAIVDSLLSNYKKRREEKRREEKRREEKRREEQSKEKSIGRS
jgi:hypothetical protein